jgi:hypothetical protein
LRFRKKDRELSNIRQIRVSGSFRRSQRPNIKRFLKTNSSGCTGNQYLIGFIGK